MNLEAHAKINLTLDITGVRENGYHDVRMIMQSLGLHDEVEIETAEKGVVSLLVTDVRGNSGKDGDALSVIPVGSDNLMCRAAKRILEETGAEFGVRMTLRKAIPVAAGLAGGSSDAAQVLIGINRLAGSPLSTEALCAIGVELGADIPYCIQGGTRLSEGIGEVLTPIERRFHRYVLLIKPEISISTPYAYGAFDRMETVEHPDNACAVAALESGETGDAKALYAAMGNVLEQAVAGEYPVIKRLESLLLENGAEAAQMSGSGPTVFGLFADQEGMRSAAARIRERLTELGGGEVIETDFF